jgi:hypothetical protein
VSEYFWSDRNEPWNKKPENWHEIDTKPSSQNPWVILENQDWLARIKGHPWKNKFAEHPLGNKFTEHPWLYAMIIIATIGTMVTMETLGYRHAVSIYTTVGTCLILVTAVRTYDRLRIAPDSVIGGKPALARYSIGLATFVAVMVVLQLIGPDDTGPFWQKLLEFLTMSGTLVALYITLKKAVQMLRCESQTF